MILLVRWGGGAPENAILGILKPQFSSALCRVAFLQEGPKSPPPTENLARGESQQAPFFQLSFFPAPNLSTPEPDTGRTAKKNTKMSQYDNNGKNSFCPALFRPIPPIFGQFIFGDLQKQTVQLRDPLWACVGGGGHCSLFLANPSLPEQSPLSTLPLGWDGEPFC